MQVDQPLDPLGANLSCFFSAAASALQREDRELRQALQRRVQESGTHSDYHQGISILFETTLVYLIFRELLDTKFPLEARWEDPYPGSSKAADLVLVDRASRRKAVVEVKLWKQARAEDLDADFMKMAALPSDYIHRLVLAVWWDNEDGDANLLWLQNKPGYRLLDSFRFDTYRRDGAALVKKTAVLALLDSKLAASTTGGS